MNGEKEVKTEKMFQAVGSWIGMILLFAAVCTANTFGYICFSDFLVSGSLECLMEQEYRYDRIPEKDCLKEIAQCADRG